MKTGIFFDGESQVGSIRFVFQPVQRRSFFSVKGQFSAKSSKPAHGRNRQGQGNDLLGRHLTREPFAKEFGIFPTSVRPLHGRSLSGRVGHEKSYSGLGGVGRRRTWRWFWGVFCDQVSTQAAIAIPTIKGQCSLLSTLPQFPSFVVLTIAFTIGAPAKIIDMTTGTNQPGGVGFQRRRNRRRGERLERRWLQECRRSETTSNPMSGNSKTRCSRP